MLATMLEVDGGGITVLEPSHQYPILFCHSAVICNKAQSVNSSMHTKKINFSMLPGCLWRPNSACEYS